MLGLGNNIFKSSTAEGSLVSNRVSFIGLLNETYGADAEAAYSVRKLSSSATVAMTIRRESDDEELAIGFVNGNINEAAIEAHCTGTTCKVVQWNDQSGNNNHATQDNEGRQPTIYTGGAIVKENGRPALIIGVAGSLQFDTAITTVGTLNWLGKTDTFLYNRPISNAVELQTNSKGYVNTIAGTNPWNPSNISLNGVVDTQSPFGSNLIGVYHNAYAIGASTINPLTEIGYTGENNRSWNGPMQEVLIYSDQRTSQRSDIEENIADYFTHNTPLLDTYSGAAAAYSLRKLKSDYTGPAISVRNASNVDLDIGFNVFGELDTVSLLAHTGSGDGFVGQWYDQSGSGNHASQTSEGDQPKIVSSGAVITENGKPAVYGAGASQHLMTSSVSLNNGEWLAFAVAARVAEQRIIGQDMSGNRVNQIINNNGAFSQSIGFNTSGSYVIDKSATFTSTTNLVLNTSQLSSNVLEAFWNGQGDGGTAHTNQTTAAAELNFFRNGTNSPAYLTGYISEVVVYAFDNSDNRTEIETNINTFYNIYS